MRYISSLLSIIFIFSLNARITQLSEPIEHGYLTEIRTWAYEKPSIYFLQEPERIFIAVLCYYKNQAQNKTYTFENDQDIQELIALMKQKKATGISWYYLDPQEPQRAS